jgi:hypothetical protein
MWILDSQDLTCELEGIKNQSIGMLAIPFAILISITSSPSTSRIIIFVDARGGRIETDNSIQKPRLQAETPHPKIDSIQKPRFLPEALAGICPIWSFCGSLMWGSNASAGVWCLNRSGSSVHEVC